jgi:hypothetical protein
VHRRGPDSAGTRGQGEQLVWSKDAGEALLRDAATGEAATIVLIILVLIVPIVIVIILVVVVVVVVVVNLGCSSGVGAGSVCGVSRERAATGHAALSPLRAKRSLHGDARPHLQLLRGRRRALARFCRSSSSGSGSSLGHLPGFDFNSVG